MDTIRTDKKKLFQQTFCCMKARNICFKISANNWKNNLQTRKELWMVYWYQNFKILEHAKWFFLLHSRLSTASVKQQSNGTEPCTTSYSLFKFKQCGTNLWPHFHLKTFCYKQKVEVFCKTHLLRTDTALFACQEPSLLAVEKSYFYFPLHSSATHCLKIH